MNLHIETKNNLELLLTELEGIGCNRRDDNAHADAENCFIAHDILSERLENFAPFTIDRAAFPNFAADMVEIALENAIELGHGWDHGDNEETHRATWSADVKANLGL